MCAPAPAPPRSRAAPCSRRLRPRCGRALACMARRSCMAPGALAAGHGDVGRTRGRLIPCAAAACSPRTCSPWTCPSRACDRSTHDAPASWVWDTLAPGGSLPFAWDDITAKHAVEVAAAVLGPGGRPTEDVMRSSKRNVYAFEIDTLQVGGRTGIGSSSRGASRRSGPPPPPAAADVPHCPHCPPTNPPAEAARHRAEGHDAHHAHDRALCSHSHGSSTGRSRQPRIRGSSSKQETTHA